LHSCSPFVRMVGWHLRGKKNIGNSGGFFGRAIGEFQFEPVQY